MDGKEILTHFMHGADLKSISIIGGVDYEHAQGLMRSELVLLAELDRQEKTNGNGHEHKAPRKIAKAAAPKGKRGRPRKVREVAAVASR